MAGKSKIDVLKVTSKSKLDEAISEYITAHRYYQRLIAMRIIAEWNTIQNAANIIGVKYQTVHGWAKKCEAEGIEGLIPNFGGGGPSKLSQYQLKELDKKIQNSPRMNIKMLKKLIEEEYKVKYSYKQVWVIARKLGYSYIKIYPKFSQSPEDAEYQLKKLKKT